MRTPTTSWTSTPCAGPGTSVAAAQPRTAVRAGGGRGELAPLEGGDEDCPHEVFDVHDLPGGPHRVGPFLLEARVLPHGVPDVGSA